MRKGRDGENGGETSTRIVHRCAIPMTVKVICKNDHCSYLNKSNAHEKVVMIVDLPEICQRFA